MEEGAGEACAGTTGRGVGQGEQSVPTRTLVTSISSRPVLPASSNTRKDACSRLMWRFELSVLHVVRPSVRVCPTRSSKAASEPDSGRRRKRELRIRMLTCARC